MPRSFSEKKQQEWKKLILSQRQSGLSIVKWCQENHINVHTFGYWRSKLFPKTLQKHSFTEIHDKKNPPSDSKETGVSIHYKEISIHLGRQFDPSTLKQCLRALKECPC